MSGLVRTVQVSLLFSQADRPDANNILGVGASLGKPVPMPTIEIAKKNMERAAELGGKDMDWSSLSAVLRENAGLPPFKVEQKKQ